MFLNKKGQLSNKEVLMVNTFWLSAIELFSKILLFIITLSLVRYWGASEFGAFNLAFAYVAIFAVLGDFGLATITVRDVAKDKSLSEKYFSNLVGLKLVLSILVIVLFLLSLIFNRNVSIVLLMATLVYYLSQVFNGIFLAIFQAWERMDLVFWNKLLYYLGMLVSAFLVIFLKKNAVFLILGYTLTTILVILVGVWQLKLLKIKFKVAFNYAFWRELIIEALPLFGMTTATVIYLNNDTLLIGRILGTDQVGWYQSAYKILFAFQSINVVNYAVFPRLSVLFNEKKKDVFNKIIKIIILFSLITLVPLAGIISWQRELIMKLIYGQSFVVASKVMSLLVWAGVINYFRVFVSNLLIIKKKQKFVFATVLLGTLISLSLNFVLIPIIGFVQAGWTLIISETIILLTMLLVLKLK